MSICQCTFTQFSFDLWLNIVNKVVVIMSLHAWIKASRLPAQLFIFPSLLLGQALAVLYLGIDIAYGVMVLVHLYGLFMHLFIVYANDYADYETDKHNQTFTPFTGGSRVIVDGLLTKDALFKGAIIMGALTITLGVILSFMQTSAFILLLIIAGIGIFLAYSFKPIKMSYRGYGESLQALGVGLVLPLVGFLAQGGTLSSVPWTLILAFLPAQYAMAIGTALPDEPSDRASHKKTTAVKLGGANARRLMIGLYLLSLILVLIQSPFTPFMTSMVTVLLMMLIFMQGLIIWVKNPLPGSIPLTILVSFSILTNTALVLSVATLALQV